jgi:prepilin-type processing-associated H-X9-DG protein
MTSYPFIPAFGWAVPLLSKLEQAPLYNAVNMDLPIPLPEQSTARSATVSIFLCPSSSGSGPVQLDFSGWVIGSDDIAPSQYVASSGQFDPQKTLADDADGIFYHNSHISTRDIIDGTSSTVLVGERSRNVADAAWIGAIGLPVGRICTKPNWPKRGCESTCMLILGRPTSINGKGTGPDGFWSLHPGGCNFLFGDGGVRFLKETIAPQVLTSLSNRAGNEIIDAEQMY